MAACDSYRQLPETLLYQFLFHPDSRINLSKVAQSAIMKWSLQLNTHPWAQQAECPRNMPQAIATFPPDDVVT